MNYQLWIERMVWAMLVLFISPFIIYNVPQLLGLDAHIVSSGSMRPTMPPGTVLYESPVDPRSLQEGDVIVFETNNSMVPENKVTHRIVDIREGNYTLQFKTMGDANPEPDPGLTPAYKIDGKKMFAIPYLGTVIQLLKSPLSIGLFVALPAAILIRSHVLKLLDALEDDQKVSEIGDGTDDNTIHIYEPVKEEDKEDFH